jgi:hypothetical protein
MIYVFDLDGTLCNIDHRLHHIKKDKPDWKAFNEACIEDKAIENVVYIADALYEFHDIIILTGRSEEYLDQTKTWLSTHTFLYPGKIEILMRPTGDFRPDHIVKKELLDNYLVSKESISSKDIAAIFEDRQSVVNMWRENGYKCLQVAPGDF